MSKPSLRDRRILVVEDEYYIADELDEALRDAGARILGPVGTVEGALALIDAEPIIDGAILDTNLRGDMAFPAAEVLMERGTPFVFATGYDASALPARFKHIARCEKPVNMAKVIKVLAHAINGPAGQSGP